MYRANINNNDTMNNTTNSIWQISTVVHYSAVIMYFLERKKEQKKLKI